MYFLNTLVAQNSVSDSLTQEISRAKSDTSLFRLTNELMLAINQQYPDSAYQILKTILPKAKEVNHLPSLLDLYYTKGLIYAKRAQYDSALVTMDKAKAIATALNDEVNLSHIIDQIGHAYFYKNQIDQGISYLKEALAIAEKSRNNQLIFKESSNLGRLYTLSEKYDSADIFINRALGIQKQLGNKRYQAEILTNLGINAFRSNKLENGVAYFNRAINLMKEINDHQGTAIVYFTIGYSFYNSGDYPNALENFHQGLTIIETTNDHQQTIKAYEALSEIYISSEDYDNALLYSQKAIDTWELAYGNQENADLLYKNGRILLLKGEATEALPKIRESLKLKTTAGKNITGDNYLNLGLCFEQLLQYDSAAVYFQKGLEKSLGSGVVLLESQCISGLARVNEKQGNLPQALEYFQEAFEIAKAGGFQAKEKEAADGLYRLYKQKNNTSQALQFLEIARALQDSLFNEENTREITRLQADFEFEKEKQQLAFTQEKENERQGNIRRLLSLALIVLSFLLAVSFFYFRAKQKANAKLSMLNEELVAQKSIVEKQKEKLEELDKAKSTFFTNISHEFRTPLTVISGLVGRLKKNPKERNGQNYDIILRNSNNLLNLVNQILDLRKLESGKLELNLIQDNIIPFLRYIFESFESLAQSKDIQVHALIENEKLVMDYDEKKVLRIVSNLLSNAIKFTPEGGDIYFIVRSEESLRATSDELPANTPSLLIQIKDTGIGIPPEKLPHIFERFYQADDSSTRIGEGTGIGLALSKELVTLLGGTIEVKSKENQGTEFIISLPISNEATLIENPKQQYLQEESMEVISSELAVTQLPELINPNRALPMVLLVEDNPDVVQYLIACLENHYNLIIAKDGQEGIEKAIEHIPDAIISDVMMPKKDGFEVCNTLKADERTSHIPIILLTAKADMESRLSGLKRGADDYLIKPFNEEELLTRLENQMEIRRKLQLRFQTPGLLTVTAKKEEEPEHEFLKKIRENLEANLDQEDYGIVHICRAIGMSRTQLHRKIKALTGQSTSYYLKKIRLHKAKELLETTDMNVSEVAFEVGFRYAQNFSTAYMEEFGIQPSKTSK